MGEVYRAEDTSLDREVAIKVLPEQFTKDPQRLARFEREAKLLASLTTRTSLLFTASSTRVFLYLIALDFPQRSLCLNWEHSTKR